MLVVLLVILIMTLLATTAFIFFRYLLPNALHHAHCNQSGVHDGTDILGCAVRVVGQTTGGLQALVGEHLDSFQNFHLLILHALDHQEQGVKPQIVGGHAQGQAPLQHIVAVLHPLFVVLKHRMHFS